MSGNDVLVRLVGQSEAAVEQVKQAFLSLGLDVKIDWDVAKRGAIGTYDATLRVVNVHVDGGRSGDGSDGGLPPGSGPSSSGGDRGNGGGLLSRDHARPAMRLVHDGGARGFDRIKMQVRRRGLAAALDQALHGNHAHDPAKSAADCGCPVCVYLRDDQYFSDASSEVFDRIYTHLEGRRSENVPADACKVDMSEIDAGDIEAALDAVIDDFDLDIRDPHLPH